MNTSNTSNPGRGNHHSNPKSCSVNGKEELKPVPNDKPPSDLDLADVVAKSGIAGTDRPELAGHLANQLCSCLWRPNDKREE